MSQHVTKWTHRDGKKLPVNLSWCGRELHAFDWAFTDAQHALLSLEAGDRLLPCKKCLKAIRRVLDTAF